jgi:hypothetical protein
MTGGKITLRDLLASSSGATFPREMIGFLTERLKALE